MLFFRKQQKHCFKTETLERIKAEIQDRLESRAEVNNSRPGILYSERINHSKQIDDVEQEILSWGRTKSFSHIVYNRIQMDGFSGAYFDRRTYNDIKRTAVNLAAAFFIS